MSNKLDDLKQAYQQPPVPKELDEMIARVERRTRPSRTKQSVLITAAAITLFIGGLNSNASFADAMAKVPVLGQLTEIVTIDWKETKTQQSADIKAPQVTLPDKALEQQLNEKYIAEGQALYEKFKQETHGQEGVFAIDSRYDIKTDTDDLLSIGRIVTETRASASESVQYDTIDKKQQLVLTLPSLFKNDRYITTISDYLKEEMRRQMKADEGKVYFVEGTPDVPESEQFKRISAKQNFYITTDHKLVLSFDEYSVAPGYMGIVEFKIPTSILKDDLVSSSYIR